MNERRAAPVYLRVMKIAIATLWFASLAAAEPVAAPKCPASGTPLLEIDHEVRTGLKGPTSVTKVYESGAWTTATTDENGKAGTPTAGCLDKVQLDKVRADLKDAPWTVRHNKIHCMMIANTFTKYSVKGKLVWTAKACNSDALDDASTKAIADIETTLVAAKVLRQ